jgi:hypothetical protein
MDIRGDWPSRAVLLLAGLRIRIGRTGHCGVGSVVFLILAAVIAAAQRPISLLEQGRPHLLDGALYASIATYRTLDYFSTRRALAGGAREVVLPQWVVNNRGTFIAFEGLATASEVGGSVWLIRHGHRRMARAVNAMSIGLGVQAVVNNYTEPLVFVR